MARTEFRVWCENGDLIEVHESWADAARELVNAVHDHLVNDHAPGEGCSCGVLHESGFFIQVVRDGWDVTQEFLA